MKKQKKKTSGLFYIVGSLALTIIGVLFIPVLLDKGTDIAYKILYPDNEE